MNSAAQYVAPSGGAFCSVLRLLLHSLKVLVRFRISTTFPWWNCPRYLRAKLRGPSDPAWDRDIHIGRDSKSYSSFCKLVCLVCSMTEVSVLFLCGKITTERLVATGCMCKRRSCHETSNVRVNIFCKKKIAKQKRNARYF
jgi:hypothetical protein